MSDPVTKAERSKAKDARQSPAPEPARIPNKKKRAPSKPWRVIGPSLFPRLFNDGEYTWHRSATREQAEAWIEKKRRSIMGVGSYRHRLDALRIEYKE